MDMTLKKVIKEQIQKQINLVNLEGAIEDKQKVEEVAELIRNAQKIAVLTGAGISTMSGIPDYRGGAEGVWMKKPDLLHTLNQLTFLSDPKQFWESYYDLFAITLSEIIPYQTDEAVMTAIDLIQPNEGHCFFAKLEEAGKEVTILTQNVDGLHQKAGSKRVLEIHGNVTTCSCPVCYQTYQLKTIFKSGAVPTCECRNVLRPNVVFFGDAVKEFAQAERAINRSDLIIVAGTSLQVSPFNQLPRLASINKIPVVYINWEVPVDTIDLDHVLQGNISEICSLIGSEL